MDAGRGEKARLLRDLLKDYDPDTKPVKNVSNAVNVKFTLAYNQLQDLVSTVVTKEVQSLYCGYCLFWEEQDIL